MREILFRGKRVHSDKKWTFGSLAIGPDWVSIWGSGWKDDVEVYQETVGQYTGKNDKNGFRIFEGDIIRFKQWKDGPYCWVGVVEYDYGSMFVVRGGQNEECGTDFEIQLSCLGEDRIEAIGNRWDNPELLKRRIKNEP